MMVRLAGLAQVAAVLTVLLLDSSAALPADYSLHYPSADTKLSCPGKKSLVVYIDDLTISSPVKLQLAESSREFMHPAEVRSAGNVCFYQGSVDGNDEQIAIGTQRNGLFSATFHYNGALYEIPEQSADKDLYRAVLIPSPKEPRTCGLSAASSKVLTPSAAAKLPDRQPLRTRRSVLMDTNSDVAVTDRKYIRLILVGDQYYYLKFGSNMTVAQSRLWDIGNYINALYKQLGVNVITVYTEVWTTDPYRTFSVNDTAGANSTEMLNNFMDYKMRNFSSRPHSAAHLVRQVAAL